MIKLKSFLGYTTAILCIFIVLATFIGNNFFAKKFVDITGVKVSPTFIGGDIAKTVSFEGYDMKIHKTVFQGLFSDRKDGFVQIDWTGKKIPPIISQEVDFDNDGKNDFFIKYDTKNSQCELKPLNKNVLSLEGTYKLKDGYALRINLQNPKK